MSLRDAMRKAASLLVELPPEEAAAPSDSADAEFDDLLAEARAKAGSNAGEPADSNNDAPVAPAPTRTVEQLVSEGAGPSLQEIETSAVQPAATPQGTVDFPAIYAGAGVPPSPFSSEQMLDMLAALPQELPLDTKRQTVKVSMAALGKTAGATPETVVADASRKMAALAAAVENLSKQTDEFTQRTEAEIEALQAKIEERRTAIQDARRKMVKLTQDCEAESDRLDDVLEFFSLDVPPSKHAAGGPAPGGPPQGAAPGQGNAGG